MNTTAEDLEAGNGARKKIHTEPTLPIYLKVKWLYTFDILIKCKGEF